VFEFLPAEEPLSAFELYVRSLEEKDIRDDFGREPEMTALDFEPEPPSPYAISTDIRQFGYDLFRQPPSTFAPVDYAPVSPDYLLGPGDEVRISVWGTINGEFAPVIDIDGKIVLPSVGVVHLSGLTFDEGKAFIEKEFSRQYKPSQVKINVSMGRLRAIRVFVVGNASNPGGYTISSYAALANALFAAGGPNKVGSLRNIQVKRNGQTLVHFDLYDLLLKGDKTKDVRLMPEDVVFIPPIGPLAGIAGNVRTPAIYEMKGETTLGDLIDMAGGLNDIAFTGRVQIIRIVDNHRQTVLEYNLTEQSANQITLQSGDVVKVFPIMENLRRVRLTGAVEREGEYGISPGMTVRDLISLAGGPKYYAFMEEAELIRVSPTPEGPVTEKTVLNLEKALAGDPEHNIGLMEDDYLMVKAVPEWELYREVAVTGEVKFPGIYTIRKGERLSSLIDRVGLTDKAYLRATCGAPCSPANRCGSSSRHSSRSPSTGWNSRSCRGRRPPSRRPYPPNQRNRNRRPWNRGLLFWPNCGRPGPRAGWPSTSPSSRTWRDSRDPSTTWSWRTATPSTCPTPRPRCRSSARCTTRTPSCTTQRAPWNPT
jgi:protein involved in polysaccharide export with SLBB domain